MKLTAAETEIVDKLLRSKGRIFLFPAEEVWQERSGLFLLDLENTVMVHIRHIQEKIELNP